MKKFLMTILFFSLLFAAVTVMVEGCEDQLNVCLEEADEPEYCYVLYKECKNQEYGVY